MAEEAKQEVVNQVVEPVKQEPQEEVKTLTQKELNALIAAAKKDGAEKLWKKAGYESEEAFESFINAARQEAEAKKTELQREKERADAAEKARAELAARAERAEAKAEALALGVGSDKVDDLVTLAMLEQGDTIKAKVEAALEKRPWFKDIVSPSISGKIKNQTPNMTTEQQRLDAELDKVFGKRIGT